MRSLRHHFVIGITTASLAAASASVVSAQAGLVVTQKHTFNIAKIGSGDMTQTLMIHGADRQKSVTQGKAKFLVFNRDVSGTEVIRLDQGKIYTSEGKRPQYKVKSIAEMRAEMEKAQRDAEKAAAENQQESNDVRLYVVNDGVKKTGQTRTINGFNTQHQVLKMTVMAENTRTKEKAPMFFVTADMWVDPSQVQAARTSTGFSTAYINQLGLDPRTTGNPYGKWIKDMYKEMAGLDGYPILTNMAFEAAGEAQGSGAAQEERSPTNPGDAVGAAVGSLLKRATKPKQEPAQNPAATAGRTLLFSSTTEVQSISTSAPAASEFEVSAN